MRSTTILAITTLVATLASAPQAAEAPASAAACAACHGNDGNSATALYPKLAGQHASYTVQTLKALKSGDRENAIMNGLAATLSEDTMAEIAAWYASQKPVIGSADPEKIALGERLYRGGDILDGVPACMSCHGPTGAGNPGAAYPMLSGQHADYTAAQLTAYRDGTRGGGQAAVMQGVAARLSPDEIDALASYIEGLH